MKIQTLGEFEEGMRFDNVLSCFVFVKHKGKWKESIAKDEGDFIGYYFLSSLSGYLSECITMVCKPEPPE